MNVIGALTLSELQQKTFVERIKKRVTNQLNHEAIFNQMKVNAVDFSGINERSATTMDETLGRQFTIPLKTTDGMDGELIYTEVNGAWLSHVATKIKKRDILEEFRGIAYSNKNFKRLLNHIAEKGYTLKPNKEYIIRNNKYLKAEKEEETLTEESDLFVLPIYNNEIEVGMLAIDNNQKIPVIGIENERTFVNEDGEITSIMADACNLSWTRCMASCLPGCETWGGCLLLFGTCLSACCGCVSVIGCIPCGICLAIGVYCLAKCRMCVYGAARPEECKY